LNDKNVDKSIIKVTNNRMVVKDQSQS